METLRQARAAMQWRTNPIEWARRCLEHAWLSLPAVPGALSPEVFRGCARLVILGATQGLPIFAAIRLMWAHVHQPRQGWIRLPGAHADLVVEMPLTASARWWLEQWQQDPATTDPDQPVLGVHWTSPDEARAALEQVAQAIGAPMQESSWQQWWLTMMEACGVSYFYLGPFYSRAEVKRLLGREYAPVFNVSTMEILWKHLWLMPQPHPPPPSSTPPFTNKSPGT